MVFADALQCKATAKSTGERCGLPAVRGYEVCRLHGGKTPRGIASANTKHGRYSKDLPTRLVGRFQDAMNDETLGDLRSEISLLDTRIGELVAGLDVELSKSILQEVSYARDEIDSAMKSGIGQRLLDAFNHLDSVVNNANSDFEIWDEIIKLIEQRRRLVDSERKRLVDLQQMITTERAMLMIAALTGIIKEHVTDGKQLAAISADIGNLIAARTSITTE